MNVLAMSNYKAIEGMTNYSTRALKRAHTMPFFVKTKTIAEKLKPLPAESHTQQSVKMSVPAFAEFLNLFTH